MKITAYNFVDKLIELGLEDIKTYERDKGNQVWVGISFSYNGNDYRLDRTYIKISIKRHFDDGFIINDFYYEIKNFVEKGVQDESSL
ncbi:MAG: hypothetical protein ACOCRX_07195 [Candidatus Woesearchaeota archaeon]